MTAAASPATASAPISNPIVQDFFGVLQALARAESGERKPITELAQEVLRDTSLSDACLPNWYGRLIKLLDPIQLLENGDYLTAYCQYFRTYPRTSCGPTVIFAAETLCLASAAGKARAAKDLPQKGLAALLVTYRLNAMLGNPLLVACSRVFIGQALNQATLSAPSLNNLWKCASTAPEDCFLKAVCFSQTACLLPLGTHPVVRDIPEALLALLYPERPVHFTIDNEGLIYATCAQLGEREFALCASMGVERLSLDSAQTSDADKLARLPCLRTLMVNGTALPVEEARRGAGFERCLPRETAGEPDPAPMVALPEGVAAKQALEYFTIDDWGACRNACLHDLHSFLELYQYSIEGRNAALHQLCQKLLGEYKSHLVKAFLHDYKGDLLLRPLTDLWNLAKRSQDNALQMFCVFLLDKHSIRFRTLFGRHTQSAPTDLKTMRDTCSSSSIRIMGGLITLECDPLIGYTDDGEAVIDWGAIPRAIEVAQQLPVERMDFSAYDEQDRLFNEFVMKLKLIPRLKGLGMALEQLTELEVENLSRTSHRPNFLKFQYIQVTPMAIQALAGYVTSLPLNSFVFNWNATRGNSGDLTPRNAEILLQALAQVASLRALDLSGSLHGYAIGGIAQLLSRMVLLEELTLQNCLLDATASKPLAGALSPLKRLRRLILSHNALDDASLNALIPALKQHPLLYELNLEKNQIGDAGAVALREALSERRTALTIWLKDNRIQRNLRKELEGCEGKITWRF